MNDATRKFPRTLNEAFGDGTSRHIQDAEETDEPPLTFDAAMRYFGAFLAGIGFMAALICAAAFWGL